MAANLFDKIAGLSDQIAPLGNKQRGMRIESDEWNTLVKVLQGLLEIDRAQEQVVDAGLADNFARKSHQHFGEVAIDWLDAGLKANVGDGTAPVTIRAVLADMKKIVDSLNAQVATLVTTVQAHQRQLDQAATDESDRSRQLRTFESRFAGIEDVRTSVTGLSSQVQGLTANVKAVLDLRSSLTDATGAPIDVAKMRQDLSEVQKLRDGLLGVDGNILRMRDVELRLREVQDALGITSDASGGLTGRINMALAAAEARLADRFDQRVGSLRTELKSANDATAATLRADLTSQVEAARAASDQATAAKLAVTEARVNARVDDRVATASAQIRSETLAAAGEQTNQRLSTIPSQISAAVAAAQVQLASTLHTQLTDELTAAVRDQVSQAETRLRAQVGAVEAKFDERLNVLPDQIQQVVAAARDSLAAELSRQVDQQIAAVRDALDAALTDRVRTAVQGALAGLPQQVDTAVQQRVGDLDAKVGAAVNNSLRDLPATVAGEVKTQVEALKLQERIDAANQKVIIQFRAELAEAIANVRARASTGLDDTVKLLRGEIDAARLRATNEAVKLSLERFRNLGPGHPPG